MILEPCEQELFLELLKGSEAQTFSFYDRAELAEQSISGVRADRLNWVSHGLHSLLSWIQSSGVG